MSRWASLRQSRWLARAAAGDERAFRSLFRALHPNVYAYLAARVWSRADAEDLTAQVFQRTVTRLASFDSKRGTPKSWVMGIARNALIDHLRARRDHASLSDLDHVLADSRYGPETAPEDARLDKVRAALDAYPPSTREMFALRYGDGLRTHEIAGVLGMSDAAVKQRFSRVLRELRRRAQNGELDENDDNTPSENKEVGYAH